jgi:glycosyltransferase involved in cell wall biosynthesis
MTASGSAPKGDTPISRVTVVIPVWGRYAKLLDEAVASVVASTVAAEIVVVDNASDEPVNVAPGARVLRSSARLSHGAARNLGLSAVRTPLVVFLDADDLFLAGGLEALVEGIEARPELSAYALALLDGATGGVHRMPRRAARTLARWPTGFALVNCVWSQLPLQGSTIARTRDVVRAGGYSDRRQGEDWALGVSLAWRGRVGFGRKPVLVYRWREDSLGQSSPSDVLLDMARAVRQRMRADAATPRWLKASMPAVALLQYAAIWLVRPPVRLMRPLWRRRGEAQRSASSVAHGPGGVPADRTATLAGDPSQR